MKYAKNLRVVGNKVFSYNTHVATIAGNKLLVHSHWSVTTSKHVNHVADVFKLTKENADPPAEDSGLGLLKTVAMAAKMGALFCNTARETNDWQARMLKAGLAGRGLIMPDDWNELTEDEKSRRLSGAIGVLEGKD